MANLKLLATGGTGFMGGSIIAKLLASSDPNIKQLSVSTLVRKQEQADVLAAKGINAILFDGLDDSEHLKRVASEHDIVIHSANGFHAASAVALIEGLAERKKATGKDVYYIQTSGTSNLADTPLTGTIIHPRNLIFSDLPSGSPLPNATKTIHAYLQSRESAQPYPQRTTDLAVIATGQRTGVKTYIVMAPTVYGVGLGAFNTRSAQAPLLIRAALRRGRGVFVGDDKGGDGTWDHVHVEDMVGLYEVLVGKLLQSAAGEDVGVLPSGEQGIYFASEGRHTWRGLAELIGRVGYELGALEAVGSVAVPVGEFAKEALGGFPGAEQLAELGFASTAVTDAQLARRLGWKPQKTDADWEAAIKEEFPVIWEKVKAEKST